MNDALAQALMQRLTAIESRLAGVETTALSWPTGPATATPGIQPAEVVPPTPQSKNPFWEKRVEAEHRGELRQPPPVEQQKPPAPTEPPPDVLARIVASRKLTPEEHQEEAMRVIVSRRKAAEEAQRAFWKEREERAAPEQPVVPASARPIPAEEPLGPMRPRPGGQPPAPPPVEIDHSTYIDKPRGHEAIPEQVGRESGGLPHETLAQATVQFDNATARFLELLAYNVRDSMRRIEDLERMFEMVKQE